MNIHILILIILSSLLGLIILGYDSGNGKFGIPFMGKGGYRNKIK